MANILEPILANVDTNVIMVVAAILVITAILAIVKKVVKLGVTILIIAIAVSMLMPMAQTFQENYSFNVSNGEIHLKVDGREYNIDKETCKNITLENKGINGYVVKAEFTNEVLEIKIPTFMMGKIKEFGEKHKIPVTLID